jgi:cytochrome b subunit of formate dehydrogenase
MKSIFTILSTVIFLVLITGGGLFAQEINKYQKNDS